mgnify:CR=1 FL=1
MALRVDRNRVKALFTSGIDAVVAQSELLQGTSWAAAACGEWSANDTVRHVLCVSRWYHSWLDRALTGDTSRPFDAAAMDEENAAALEALGPVAGPEAARQFSISAHDYLERVDDSWDVPYGYPYGLVTAGLHAGIAATEWHLHAWDLSTVTGREHVPNDAEGLFLAAGACLAARAGGVRGALMSVVVPLAARRSPWKSMVERSGRGRAARRHA